MSRYWRSTYLLFFLSATQLWVNNVIAQNCLQPAEDGEQISVKDINGPRLLNGTQAIVTSYQFNCCGDITAWEAAVERDGGNHNSGVYTIHFQVWRPSPTVETDGCYSLVGENRFSSIILLPNRLVSETPEPTNIISVQPGDVVGYFATSTEGSNDGIQLHEEDLTGETVWYHTDTEMEPLIPSGESCPFPVGSEPGRTLRSFTNLGPIVSAVISIMPSNCQSTPSSLPQPTMSLSSGPVIPTTDTTISPELFTPTIDITDGPDGPNVTGLTIGLAILALIFMISTVVIACIAVFIFKKKRFGKQNAISNPNYAAPSVSVKKRPPETEAVEYASTPTSEYSYAVTNRSVTDTDYHHYASADVAVPKKGPVAKPEPLPRTDLASGYSKLHEMNGISETDYYAELGAEYCDPDRIGEDLDATYATLFAQSYKVKENTVFESTGQVVPSQRDRKTASGSQNESETYNKLNFFVDDHIYWTPGATTSEIYDQLASKKYREISRKQLQVLEHLGSGQFGTVSKGLWSISNDSIVIAIKQLHPEASTKERVKLLREAAIMGQFCHPNVVKLYGLVTMDNPLMVCIEFMKNGDLKEFISHMDISKEVSAEIKDMRFFFVKASREIAAGMQYLSKKSFVHRDLAARNILLSESLTCKVGDFGLARDLMDDTYYTAQGGSKIPVKWTAPEALVYHKYSSDSDVYSYGMVLFEIWSVAKKPFTNMSNQEVIRATQAGCCQSPPPGCPKAFYKLMVDCWNPSHQYRPKFSDICSYLQQPISKLLYWSPSDSTSSPEAAVLGGPLKNGFKLYTQLQNKHRNS